ncbi:putative small heat shock protein (HSP20) family protein (fragment) [Cupriavidus taiwanensis]|uniref:Putative small heat shock protein (HSP20) family protein n=1 Tax=Cupriavidus taiwanensis TaxID=164546 RepID=A0A375JCL1_9BURK
MNETTQVAERNQNAVTKGQGDRSTPTMTLLPAADLVEDSNGVALWADLPGVTKDKLEVNVHDGNLHIEAEAVVPTPKDCGCSTRRFANRTSHVLSR